jgi:hypothetical protein
MSNGWNRIFFINSNASPNGLKISIVGSVSFMRGILKRFAQTDQARTQRAGCFVNERPHV